MNTYEVYYRDYKKRETLHLGCLPERRKDPTRDRSQASIVRWARAVFGGAFADPNAIFVVKAG
jgi:hypothetical protein